MFLERKLYPALKEHLSVRQITVITGMRRTGKTTLVKKLLEDSGSNNTLYIDLDQIEFREVFSEKNYDRIFERLKQEGLRESEKMYIGIDEIQLVPNIPSVLKYLYDQHDIKFIVSGSSSYYIKNLFQESMAGRKRLFELYPLDFGEFLEFKQIKYTPPPFQEMHFDQLIPTHIEPLYDEYITYDGFPEVVLAETPAQKKDLLRDIISSYMSIDIKYLHDFEKEKELYLLIKLLAARSSSRFDVTKLSNLTGLSRPTINNYIDLFENTYLITRLSVHSKSIDRESVKTQKLYFQDNGLLNILADVNSGTKFENAVFAQLRSHGQLHYFSTSKGKEIDFILDGKQAFEVKERATESDQKQLEVLSKEAGIDAHALISRYPVPSFSRYIWGGSIV